MDEVVKRILSEMKNNGFDQKQMAIALEISPQIITDWKKGKTNSYTRYIQKISDLFGVSADYLLTGQTAVVDSLADDPLLAKAKEKFSLLTDAEKLDIIEAMIQKIAER